MKKTILYTVSIVAAVAIAAFVGGGCDGDFGERSDKMNKFLDKFHYNKKVLPKYTLTYDGNGATGNAPIDEMSPYDSGDIVIIMDKGELKNGNAVFSKWNSQPDGRGKYSCVYKNPFQINADIIFYAQWDTDKTFEVKVESLLAGTLVYGNGNFKPGDPVIITAGTPPEGWRFQEWTSASKDVSFEDANSSNTSFIMPENSVLIKAVFVANSGKVSLLTDDRDGKTYITVTILKQTWMARNLDYVNDMTTSDSSWCYENNPDNCNTYGRLYTWNAAIKICPAGWRLPDTADWNRLINAVGGSNVAEKKLRSTDWHGTDEYGFSALPGGYWYSGWRFYGDDSYFSSVEVSGFWWTATERTDYANYVQLPMGLYERIKKDGFSVRCIKTE